MERRSAKRANAYAEEAIRKTLLALRIASTACTPKEYKKAKRGAGLAIAHLDEFLQETVYRHHPDLDKIRAMMEKEDAQKQKRKSGKPKK
jgi:hypothetical protein